MAYRIEQPSRIDRTRPLQFSLEGRSLGGFAGDTLASALLANGVTLAGRSFKYHRPRGFLAAGFEEPNGLFTVGTGARTEPNVQGTTLELVDGLVAARQNAWPSVEFDAMSINALLAPALSSGFYYKTFMGPTRGSWMFYEPFIRRAAGLGRGVHAVDPDRYFSRHAFADVLVIGGGPAGLVAALTAARSGARVVLVEQEGLLGGCLLRERVDGGADHWLRHVVAALGEHENVAIRTRTTAIGLYDGNTVALVERHDGAQARQIVTTLLARSIVFATGALERPCVFPNNDRPGVMLASAVRAYLNRFSVSCGQRAVVATNNDSAYETAFDLARSGVDVVVADARHEIDAGLARVVERFAIRTLLDASVVDVLGRKAVRGVVVKSRASRGTFECDLVCMSGGWTPTVHLTSHGGIKPQYSQSAAAFVPGGYTPGHFAAGAITGEPSPERSVEHGIEVGRAAAAYAGHGRGIPAIVLPPLELASCANATLPFVQALTRKQAHAAFVDFQNDVTVADLDIACEEGYRSLEHLKRYTTLGMGTDQGRTSNVNAMSILASRAGGAIDALGTTTFRPPFAPVTIGALAGRAIGKHFRPTRRSPLHEWHVANGVVMTQTGPWLRPWYYRWAGTDVGSAYLKEMRLVRQEVGISDVSTLGKIEIQGPDAAQFLDRVYVNNFANLPVGKMRYGVMLNDDATVLDDGTTARFAESTYFLTTTTAQSGEVMSWLEFLLQAAWTHLRVTLTSVTDEWAGMVVAGPKARAVLERALEIDISNAALPYMGCVEAMHDGVRLRVLRTSFSGELAYEMYVPADYGIAMWQHLLERGAPFGMRPYGLEALASLRIEKGHVASLELDHRTTLDDLGMGKLASTKKSYVGESLRQRPHLQDHARWSLVGIECLEPGKRLRGGSILFAANDRIEGHGRGYITSVTWSTELSKFIALGLYQGGVRHAGDEVICAFPLKGEQVRARVVAPTFIDPQGERLRA